MESVRRRVSPDAFALAAAVVSVAGIFVLALVLRPTWLAQDAIVYQAAAERLNAGHELYALSPGDRVIPMFAPFWTVPLLSPPLIAVLWRPLAFLPYPLGVAIWWMASNVALFGAAVVLFRAPALTGRRRYVAAIVVALLSQAIAVQLLVGNVDALLIAGAVVVWGAPRRWDAAVGVIVALMAGVKLLPIAFGWWLVCQGRWRAVGWMAVALAVLGGISLLGAGLDAHVAYLGIAHQTTVQGATPESLGGVARMFGVPDRIAALLPIAFFGLSAVAMFVLRDRPGVTYTLAVLASVFGSPVVNTENLARLLPLLAPLGTGPVRQIQLPDLAPSPAGSVLDPERESSGRA